MFSSPEVLSFKYNGNPPNALEIQAGKLAQSQPSWQQGAPFQYIIHTPMRRKAEAQLTWVQYMQAHW
eukprot:247965-Pelagomonas_calceolata.AAC.9